MSNSYLAQTVATTVRTVDLCSYSTRSLPKNNDQKDILHGFSCSGKVPKINNLFILLLSADWPI